MISGLIEGRIVHFIPSEGCRWRYPGRHIPGVVVMVWDKITGCSNLRLFTDCGNDHDDWQKMEWPTSVCYDPEGIKPYSWHFPEKVE